ncbi:MAG: Fic family protein [Gammaproteobacteria bacterium]|nr:Fic family protein [Gammaproteobacteria bacterium]MBU1415563.1 Fic family protein [Gammaproteobacteria bacterium]
MKELAQGILAAGPRGISPDALGGQYAGASRSTLNRRLRELVVSGRIKAVGRGPGTRYVSLVQFPEEDIRRYFETDWQARPAVAFHEDQLLPEPAMAPEKAVRLRKLSAISRSLDRKFLADFLIDFSWASALLEGSTYSAIDTQALIEYGQRNPEKPLEDALLILNHKNAIEYLWMHRELSVETLCQLQSLLTDRHGLPEAADSDHFLPDEQRGLPREFEEVRLGRSAYGPPFRPGTGYVGQALAQIVSTAKALDPVAAALYLMTRLPYLQAFANGNKRTSRLAANLPLLAAGMLPISFVDFAKADYVLGMSAFYELGDIQIVERVFIQGYVRSIVRGSDLPASVRVGGFNVSEVVGELVKYVQSGQLPRDPGAAMFLTTGRTK